MGIEQTKRCKDQKQCNGLAYATINKFDNGQVKSVTYKCQHCQLEWTEDPNQLVLQFEKLQAKLG